MLKVTNLSKTYGSGGTAFTAIADISFEAAHGEFTCLVGPSGSGKTTLLRCLSGLLKPTSGKAWLEGDLIDGPPEKLALVFQEYTRSLLPWLTVEKNVSLPLPDKGMSRSAAREAAHEALEAVGLHDVADKHPWQLSGGMQQRVAIARALAYKPHLLLMDEPFASVDAQTRADLEDLVQQVRADFGITILHVTHDIDEAVYLADRIVVLTKAPSQVAEVVPVPLAKPRDQIATKEDPVYLRLRAQVLRLVQSSKRVTSASMPA